MIILSFFRCADFLLKLPEFFHFANTGPGVHAYLPKQSLHRLARTPSLRACLPARRPGLRCAERRDRRCELLAKEGKQRHFSQSVVLVGQRTLTQSHGAGTFPFLPRSCSISSPSRCSLSGNPARSTSSATLSTTHTRLRHQQHRNATTPRGSPRSTKRRRSSFLATVKPDLHRLHTLWSAIPSGRPAPWSSA